MSKKHQRNKSFAGKGSKPPPRLKAGWNNRRFPPHTVRIRLRQGR